MAHHHLPNIVQAVARKWVTPRRMTEAHVARLYHLCANNVKAPELVKHCNPKWLPILPQVDYPVSWNDCVPLCSPVRLIESKMFGIVELQEYGISLDVPDLWVVGPQVTYNNC